MAQINNQNISQNFNFGNLKKIKIKKGDTENIKFNLKINNVAINLSNKTLKLVLKSDVNSLVNVLLKEVVIPDDVNSQNGIYYLVLSSIESNITAGIYYAEVEIRDTTIIPNNVLSSSIFAIEVEKDLI